MRTGNFLTLAQLLVSVFAFSACARATAVPPTSVAQVAATNTLVPPTATHTALPPTLTPTNTSTQTATVTNTFTPTRTNTPTVISSPTTTATSTLTPTEVPPTATRTATRKPATRVPPTPTTAALAPLNVTQRTFEPRVAHDSIQKILGRQGAAIFVINNYNAPMTFTFPGNESMTALVTERVGYLPLDSVRNSPFTIPPGGWLLGIFNEGDIAWSAVISGVGQAQGGVTLSRAQDVELKFGN